MLFTCTRCGYQMCDDHYIAYKMPDGLVCYDCLTEKEKKSMPNAKKWQEDEPGERVVEINIMGERNES